MTASLGVSVKHDGMRGFEDLLKDADAALYRAKDAGRNRVAGPPAERRESA